jgi:DNA-binding NarL/FixJ family response regulator
MRVPVKPKQATIPGARSAEPGPRRHLQVVFAREDVAGSAEGPALAARILIVEDDYLVATQMEAALTDAGFDVAGVAASAEEALALAIARRPALVVMDVRLSGKRDGIDAALELFGSLGIRCVFATAHHDAKVRVRAKAAAPLGWVPKPYTMAALVDAVGRACRELQSEKS